MKKDDRNDKAISIYNRATRSLIKTAQSVITAMTFETVRE